MFLLACFLALRPALDAISDLSWGGSPSCFLWRYMVGLDTPIAAAICPSCSPWAWSR